MLADYDYTYDLAGRVIAESHHGQSSSYQYDPTSQLLHADHSQLPDEVYAYDANGNPLAANVTVGPNNQILADARAQVARIDIRRIARFAWSMAADGYITSQCIMRASLCV